MKPSKCSHQRIKDTVRNNLFFIRKERNMSQQEFSEILGIKRSLLGAYEERRAEPRIDIVVKVGTIFNYTLDDLYLKPLDKRQRAG